MDVRVPRRRGRDRRTAVGTGGRELGGAAGDLRPLPGDGAARVAADLAELARLPAGARRGDQGGPGGRWPGAPRRIPGTRRVSGIAAGDPGSVAPRGPPRCRAGAVDATSLAAPGGRRMAAGTPRALRPGEAAFMIERRSSPARGGSAWLRTLLIVVLATLYPFHHLLGSLNVNVSMGDGVVALIALIVV